MLSKNQCLGRLIYRQLCPCDGPAHVHLLHTENQLPRLPGSALKVPVVGGGWVGSYPLSSQAPTHVEVELGCDNL